jgi:hypothetical protein
LANQQAFAKMLDAKIAMYNKFTQNRTATSSQTPKSIQIFSKRNSTSRKPTQNSTKSSLTYKDSNAGINTAKHINACRNTVISGSSHQNFNPVTPIVKSQKKLPFGTTRYNGARILGGDGPKGSYMNSSAYVCDDREDFSLVGERNSSFVVETDAARGCRTSTNKVSLQSII